ASFCAGIARRSLDPNLMDMPEPRAPVVRLLFGPDAPPLGGFGARLRLNPLQYFARRFFPDAFFSHIFLPSEGTRDPEVTNNAKALVLVDAEGTALYWVKTDLIGAFGDLRAAVIRELRRRGLDEVHDGNFLLHATHTHSGVGGYNPRGLAPLGMDTFSPPIMDALVAAIADAAQEARGALRPARLGFGRTAIEGIAMNRRETCAALGDPPNPPPDPEIGIVRIDSPDGAPIATLFNHAIHGVRLPPENLRFSPDLMGYAEARVAARGGGEAFFFNAAEGDVNPVEDTPVEVIGERLGDAVADKVGTLATSPDVRLRWDFCRIDDPATPPDYANPCPHNFAAASLPLVKSFETDVPGCFAGRDGEGWTLHWTKETDVFDLEREGVVFSAFSFEVGGAHPRRLAIAAQPGEPITAIGHEIKDAARGDLGYDDAWVVGLANGHVGYIVTEEEYVEGGYETALNLFGPGEGRVSVANAVDLLRGLARGAAGR
ncbi:MAG: neutral/alkaline non-lysosomal ceramidase N-terminal domain-containing protein, partial [Myxococcales bacterium]|nr:neutral/alkaline non-lysosomal ceramidase N-terminal domain-containing protein [Myxococcales bacterium]